MFFEEYDTYFFGDCETLDFIEISLSNVIRRKYRFEDSLELRVTTERPLEAYIVNFLRKNHDFMMYVAYCTKNCGCWSFCNGKEISASLQPFRRGMYRPISYKKFVDKENLLMDVIYNLLNGMSYKGLINITKLAEVEKGLLIQNSYSVDPMCEYDELISSKECSDEDNRFYLEFCKANKSIVENIGPEEIDDFVYWEEEKFFNADKENVIKLLSSGDLEIPWYWHLTVYEYAALALPEIQRRLKTGDESAYSMLEDICLNLDVYDVSGYKKWLIEKDNFEE